jgi:hypothetical protein
LTEDETAAKSLATIAAQRLLLGKLYAMVYVSLNLSPEQIQAMHRQIREGLAAQALYPSRDPVVSDALSDEVAAEIDRFLTGLEAVVGMAAPEPPKARRTRRRS